MSKELSMLPRFVTTLTDIRNALDTILRAQGDRVANKIEDFPRQIDSIFSTLDKTFTHIGYGDYIPLFINDSINYSKALIADNGIIPKGIITDENFMLLKNDPDLRFLPKLRITGTKANELLLGCYNLICTADIEVGDDVEDCTGMFRDCRRLTNIDGLKLSENNQVKTVNSMFYSCENLINIPDNVVRGNCSDMKNIFTYCNSLNSEVVNTLGWDTTSITSFDLGSNLPVGLKIDTRNWDLTGATIATGYGKWINLYSLVGDASAEYVDDNTITALKNFEGSLDLSLSTGLGASYLTLPSLLALINGAAKLKEGETRTFKFYNENQKNKLGDYKDVYLQKLKDKGWEVL